MMTHCIRNFTLTSAIKCGEVEPESPPVWPIWLAPGLSFVIILDLFISLAPNKSSILNSVLLLLEVMAQPTSVMLDEEGCEEGGVTKLLNKKSEYGKILSVSHFLTISLRFDRIAQVTPFFRNIRVCNESKFQQ